MRVSSALTRLLFVLMMVGALILVLLAEGCSNTPQSPAASPTTSAPPTSTAPKTPTPLPKPGGSLTLAADIGAGVFDPKFGTPRGYMTTGFRVFDLLIEPDPDGRPAPGIAEKWEFSKDGLAHTFYIRKGVKFHDGSDLTGADVKFSLDRILAADSRHPDAATWRTQIASVELVGDWTIVVKMKQPIWELIQGFNNYGGSTAVVPKKYIEAKGDDYFGKNPIGSGPYKVTKIEIGNRMEFEAVDSHWKETAKFKNITALFVNEEATVVAMLKTGELDLAAISADSVAGAKAAGLRIVDWDGGAQAWQFVFWDAANPKDYALSDVRVRKALSLGINRQEMADKLYGGFARPSVAFRVLPSAYFFDPNVLKADPYDPDGSKKLMADAGYPSGFNLKYWEMGAGGPMTTINQALAGYWRKIGV
ncbi:MAG: ABC transporter substrate-binding protein, partial [Dehalococcoidia bacterium]|nr:ABC transporter substrate-binding protein [Dehalococcoidia bacterium]